MLSMGRKRSKPRDLTDPRGQLGAYVEAWIDKHHDGDKSRLADSLGLGLRTVQKWCEGESSPDFSTLNRLAQLLGHADWIALGGAVSRFVAKRK